MTRCVYQASSATHNLPDMAEGYHFVGIGGAGMSGMARLLLAAGASVTGSDAQDSDTVHALRAAGARVAIGHAAENLGSAARVIYSAAVPEDNPELVEARRRGLPVIPRARLLGELMGGKRGIAVAGTHGKSTTTGMMASVFLAARTDPTVLIGADWPALDGNNARSGSGPYFIAEACEAFSSFLELRPQVAVLTNIDADHLDCHGSIEGVVEAFRRFVDQVDPSGLVVGCRDDARVRRLLSRVNRRVVTYGLEDGADYVAVDLDLDQLDPSFTLVRHGEVVGSLRIGVPGRHNVLNALAVVAVTLEEGLPWDAVQDGLCRFSGVGRRFETLGEVEGILVLDDYAHHPTEIRATLAALAQSVPRPITVVFQPHLYSRTQLLLEEFANSFAEAERIYIAEIYAAREEPVEGVSGELLAERIQELDPDKPVEFVPDRAELLARLREESYPGDVVMVMGAGDIRKLGEELVESLRIREQIWARFASQC